MNVLLSKQSERESTVATAMLEERVKQVMALWQDMISVIRSNVKKKSIAPENIRINPDKRSDSRAPERNLGGKASGW